MQTRKTRQKLTPALVFPPGKILSKELKARGIAIQDLPDPLVNKVSLIIEEKQQITLEIAQELSNFLGTSWQLWLNLENDYQAFKKSHSQIKS